MFSNLSNWINTNIPQSIPTVNMPSMPNVQMPKIPDLFSKNKNAEEQQASENQTANEENQTEQQQEQLLTTSTAVNADENQPDAEIKSKFTLNTAEINQNAQKAIGAAKEMSSNLGSK
jgi:hypothetical protein